MDKTFLNRVDEVLRTSFTNFLDHAKEDEKALVLAQLNTLLANKTKISDMGSLNTQLATAIKSNPAPEFYSALAIHIAPALSKTDHRE